MSANFADRLAAAVQRTKSPICVGLDPRVDSLPFGLLPSSQPTRSEIAAAYSRFCREVIDVVAGRVPIVKPQAAFFEQIGPEGMLALADTIAYARAKGLLVIVDGKRNDIGSTATAYADGYLGAESPWQADCLTVSPYLGHDSLEPFVEVAVARSAGLFVLVKTSNPGGAQWQDLPAPTERLYRQVGAYVDDLAGKTLGACNLGAIGAVVGATHPAQQDELRAAMPRTWFLVPGFGAQGAGAADVRGSFREDGLGAIINNSRGIIFAHKSKAYAQYGDAQWQDAIAAATTDMQAALRAETPAGKL